MNVFDAIPQSAAQTPSLHDAKVVDAGDIRPRPELVNPAAAAADRLDPAPDKPPEEVISAAVSRLNDYVQSVQKSLRFTVDEATGRTVITVLDAETDEVLRQMPPAQLLAALREIAGASAESKHKGLLVRETV